MASGEKRTGRCLCGAATFTVDSGKNDVGACHCSMCRRWSGGPFLVLDAGNSVTLSGEDTITVYKSSEWGERGFCSKCGSNLFWRMADGSHYVVSAGALDDQDGLNLTHQIFFDEKPDYYDFANETARMTGEEVFAMFAAGGSDEG